MFSISSLIHKIESTKGKVLAIAQYPHPQDNHLFTVLIKMDARKYVTWVYNASDNGFFSGHYFEDFRGDGHDPLPLALSDFSERMKKG